jgi:hypothetical protein
MTNETETETAARAALEARYGKVWNTGELKTEYEVLQFSAPCVVVRRRCDGIRGTLYFQPSPRFYFSFQPEGV